MLGDSFTESRQVSLQDSWVKKLEEQLNSAEGYTKFEVMNAGCAGYGSHQEALWFEKNGTELNPDIVLVVFFPNDIADDAYIKEALKKTHLDQSAGAKNGSTSGGLSIKDFLKKHLRIYKFFSEKIKKSQFVCFF